LFWKRGGAAAAKRKAWGGADCDYGADGWHVSAVGGGGEGLEREKNSKV